MYDRKLQAEEVEAEQRYMERIKQDELLAKQIQDAAEATVPEINKRECSKNVPTKPRLRARKIDTYLSKLQAPVKEYVYFIFIVIKLNILANIIESNTYHIW